MPPARREEGAHDLGAGVPRGEVVADVEGDPAAEPDERQRLAARRDRLRHDRPGMGGCRAGPGPGAGRTETAAAPGRGQRGQESASAERVGLSHRPPLRDSYHRANASGGAAFRNSRVIPSAAIQPTTCRPSGRTQHAVIPRSAATRDAVLDCDRGESSTGSLALLGMTAERATLTARGRRKRRRKHASFPTAQVTSAFSATPPAPSPASTSSSPSPRCRRYGPRPRRSCTRSSPREASPPPVPSGRSPSRSRTPGPTSPRGTPRRASRPGPSP